MASFFNLRIGAYANDGRNISRPPQHPVRVRKRVPLSGQGPRAVAVAGSRLYVANYFSDNLCRLDLAEREPKAESLPLWTFHGTGAPASGPARSETAIDPPGW
ncbi:MAG: hypothetical protein FJ398_04960 [Verrucomicrobia bacterium]|nr:hypothetical protein [Verrucomicrobiota bacterium]